MFYFTFYNYLFSSNNDVLMSSEKSSDCENMGYFIHMFIAILYTVVKGNMQILHLINIHLT